MIIKRARKYFPIRNSRTGISKGRTLFSAIKRYTITTNRALVHIRCVMAKWHWDVFPSNLFRLNLSVLLAPVLHVRLHFTTSTQLLSKKQAVESLETSNKVKFFWISDNTGQNCTVKWLVFCPSV